MTSRSSSEINDALIVFSRRWRLDGDYLRCVECKRPHLASNADLAFLHHVDCTKRHADHANPWHDLRDLLRSLPDKRAPTPPAGEVEP